VSDYQHVDPAHHSDRLPPCFAIDLAILHRNVKRILKYQTGNLEADAMLFPVSAVFSFIPRVFHARCQ